MATSSPSSSSPFSPSSTSSQTPSGSLPEHASDARVISRRRFLRIATLLGTGAVLGVAGCSSPSNAAGSSDTASSSAPSGETASSTSSAAVAPENLSAIVLATFMLMSDVHINNGNDDAVVRFRQALADIAALEHRPEAIAVIGDLADQGYADEHEIFKGIVAESDFSLTDMIIAMGNHDLWVVDDPANEELVTQQKAAFVQAYSLPDLYYETTVAGQHVVVLGPDKFCEDWVHFDMSNEQLNWLDDILSRDGAAGVHTYVFCHEPLNNTVAGTEEGSWGSRNSFYDYRKLAAVMDKYPQAVFLSGHTHVYPGVEASDATRPIYVNDGSCARSYKPATGERGSWGMQMQIFSDHLEFNVRDFENHTWLDEPIIVPFAR